MKALLVIDMINDFIDENGVLYIGNDGRNIIGPITEKINEYQDAHDTIFIICDSHTQNDPEFKLFPKHAVTGTWGCMVVPEIADVFCLFNVSNFPVVIGKNTFDAFHKTSLLDMLKRSNIDTVEIVGCCTSICVGATAMEAGKHGISVEIPSNCVADFDQEAHEFFLKYLKNIHGVKIT